MAQLLSVRLNRIDAQPWGLRLQGGADFGTPLVVQKVNLGSIADAAGLEAGDALIKVNNIEVFNLRHKDAQDIIVRSGNNFEVIVQRGGSTWRPSVTPTGNLPSPGSYGGPVTKTSLAHKQPVSDAHIGCGYNNAPRPFAGGQNGVKSIVNKQYNTPVGIYSEESIAETLSAQAEVLAGGVLGVNFKKNEKVYNSAGSEVLKALQEAEKDPIPEPEYQSVHAHAHAHRPVTKHVHAPETRPVAPSAGLPSGQNICGECERLIIGVFVRIKDKNLHVECFKCATCGTSLKNQGYFNLNNKLYCDIHAKLAAIQNPPPGTEGYRPVPIQPNTKLSANTISAALSAHHPNGGPAQNLDNTLTNHSRTSSSASSVGSLYISSTDSNKTTPSNTVSPTQMQATDSLDTNADIILPNIPQNQLLYTNDEIEPKEIDICSFSKQIENDKLNGNDVHDGKLDGDKENEHINNNGNSFNENFMYKTLNGGIVRSVHPPGKGSNTIYKVNSNLGGPRPFGGNQPPLAGPRSPATYPPPVNNQNWPSVPQNNYGTLPRSVGGQNAPGRYSTLNPGYNYNNIQVPPSVPDPKPLQPDNEQPTFLDDYVAGHATELLIQSVNNMAVTNVKDDFRIQASKTINSMLEARLNARNSKLSNNNGCINGANILNNNKNYANSTNVVNDTNALAANNDLISKNSSEQLLQSSPPLSPALSAVSSQPNINQIADIADDLSSNPITIEMPAACPNNIILSNDEDTNIENNTTEIKPISDNCNIVGTVQARNGPAPGKPSVTFSPHLPNNDHNRPNNVVYRNENNTNPELKAHARERRSFNDQSQRGVIQSNNRNSQTLQSMQSQANAIAAQLQDGKHPVCCVCHVSIARGPFITALGKIWCPDHFVCVNSSCRRPLQDIGFVEEKGDLYCEYCFEKFLAPACDKCNGKIKGDCLNAIGKHFHPECFTCAYCGKLFGNSPFFLEDGKAYCEADWNELFTTKCFACGFPVEAGDRWVEALSHNYHSQCFNCSMCKKNLEGQSFYAKNGRPYCKNHAR